MILKLTEHGELNQSRLMSYCGLNNVKHKGILDELVEKGAKKAVKYRVPERGRKLANRVEFKILPAKSLRNTYVSSNLLHE